MLPIDQQDFIGVLPKLAARATGEPVIPLHRVMLLFDRIGVCSLDRELANVPFSANHRADLDWLQEEGILVDPERLIPDEALATPSAAPMLHRGVQAMEQSADGFEKAHTILEREIARLKRQADSLRSGKKPDRRILTRQRDVATKLETVARAQKELSKIFWARGIANQLREGLELDATLLVPWAPGVEPAGIGDDAVLRVVLNALPEPESATPLEVLRDFRRDPSARASFTRLKRWAAAIAQKPHTAPEILDEVRHLLADYEEHMRIHRMKVRKGFLETIVTAAGDLVEHTVRLRFGHAARALFAFSEARVTLLEAEQHAPGREVAYVAQAHARFASVSRR
jgi:hypothetical protein